MAKKSHEIHLALRRPRANEPLSAWLYRELREAILSGRLKAGAPLPPTRSLAKEYGIARGTVVAVFEQMISEGYLESRVGSGTTVNRRLPDEFFRAREALKPTKDTGVRGGISKRGRRMASPFLNLPILGGVRAFCANQPSVMHFPTDVWSRLGSRRMRLASREMLLADDATGYRPLRESIAAHVGSTRGVVCEAEQVFVVSGTQQALDLVTRVVLDPGDEAWMEDPGYIGAAAILKSADAKIVPVPVDERGMRIAEGIKRAPRAKFAYATPAHQFPLCVTLPLERRLQLLEWSRETGAWIFEDDYDSEFRFAGRPLAAMQGLAPEGNVIFSGSFSKMLFPSLRLGFLVVPPHLVEALRGARSVTDRYAPMLEQAVLNDFISEGHFGQHLRRMREVYAEHLDVLMTGTEREWGERLVLQKTDTGLQTVAWLGGRRSDVEIAKAAAGRGVELGPLSLFAQRWKGRSGLQVGFAAVGPKELRRGIEAVAGVLDSMK